MSPRSALAFVLAVTSAPAWAADGRRAVHAGTTQILAAGSYYLTESLVVPSGSPIGIEIKASDVTLDLNGNTISSAGTTNVLVQATNVTNIRITNGQIMGGGEGVKLLNSASGVIPYRFRVDRLNLSGQASNAVNVQGSVSPAYPIAGIIEDNNITKVGNTGIILTRATSGRVVRNSVNGGSNGIFLVDCTGVLVADNTCTSGSGAGIELLNGRRNAITGNTCSDRNWGIYVGSSHDNKLAHNTASDNTAVGILLELCQGNHVHDNSAPSNGQGILLDGSSETSIERNSAENNVSYGIHLDNADLNSIDWNSVSGSGTTCPIQLDTSDNNTLTFNRTARSTTCAGTNGIGQSGSAGNTLVSNLP